MLKWLRDAKEIVDRASAEDVVRWRTEDNSGGKGCLLVQLFYRGARYDTCAALVRRLEIVEQSAWHSMTKESLSQKIAREIAIEEEHQVEEVSCVPIG